MKTITYETIKVEGFPFTKIIKLEISHVPNEHGVAEIVGELDSETAQDALSRVDETTLIKILHEEEGQMTVLFVGCVGNIELESQTNFSKVILKVVTLSSKLDAQKNKRSFQNVQMTYGQMLEKVVTGVADTHIMVSDRAIGALIMQYNETNWAFVKRMAANLKAPIVTGLSDEKAQLYFGLPPSRKSFEVSSKSFRYGLDEKSYNEASANGSNGMHEDFTEQSIISYEYAYIGDTMLCNGNANRIKSVHAKLKNGILEMEYALLHHGTQISGNMSSIAVVNTTETASQSSGKMMLGKVMAVNKDMVQVHLVDIDSSEYDGGGTWWFPYSTAYSSSDGSGWYCMPEVSDMVRVFFPSGSEGDAFAASSVCISPPTNTKDKSWKAPGGKEILLTDEGLYIIGNEGKVFINLTDEKGIEIFSDKNINISSETQVNILAGNDIKITAKNEIVIGTESAYINLTKDSATLMADEVLIN